MYDLNVPDYRAALDLGLILGQRRAFAAVGGRPSPARREGRYFGELRRSRDVATAMTRPWSPTAQ